MKHFLNILLVAFTLSCFSQNMEFPKEQDFESGVVLFALSEKYEVKHIPFTEDFSVKSELLPEFADIFEKYGLISLSRPYLAFENPVLERIIKMRFIKTEEIDNLLEELGKRKDLIQYVEKNPIRKPLFAPNDPLYKTIDGKNMRWHLDMIYAEGAWTIQQGTPNIKVAIVDNYVWGAHPDLNISSSNLYNAYNNSVGNASPTSTPLTSYRAYDDSHGTHGAGLVGAINNNNTGVASIGGGVTLMGIRAANSSGYLTRTAEGVAWAVQKGAKVINMSYGSEYNSPTESSVFQQYANQGVVLVASAGNEGDEGNPIIYPAGYSSVISVASVNGDGKLSDFSQYEATRADIAAPGGFIASASIGNPNPSYPNILSTTYCYPYNLSYSFLTGLNYDGMQGTSMSSPIAAGLCGLLLSYDSTLTPTQIKTILQRTASPLHPSSPTTIGGNGYINAFTALMSLDSSIFKASKSAINSPYSQNIDSLLIVSHYNFTVSGVPSWISTQTTNYYGESKRLILHMNENFSLYPRSCVLSIYCPTLNRTLQVNITQAAYPNGALFANKDTVRISSSQGSTSTLLVKSNIQWTLNGTIPAWLSVDNTSGDTITQLVFTANSANSTGANRLASFTLSGSGVPNVDVTVLQSTEELYFYTDKSLVNLGSSIYSRDTIWITSNTDWEIVGFDSNLVSIVPTSGYGNGFIVVYTKAKNDEYSSVVTTAGFCSNGSSHTDVQITQRGADHFIVEQTTYTIGADQGSTVSIPVHSNVSWSVIPSGVIWVASNMTAGQDSMVVVLTAMETNNTGATRSTSYTIRTTFSIKKVTVNQESKSITNITDTKKESLKVYPNPTNQSVNISAGEQPIKQIQVFAVTGNMLQDVSPNNTTATVDLSNYSSGIYFLKIRLTDNTVLTRKITKQ